MGYEKRMKMETGKIRTERKEKRQGDLSVGEQLNACCVVIDICSKHSTHIHFGPFCTQSPRA